jgi:CheY-like chemotaxis protein
MKKTILVIEDNDLNMKLVRSLLKMGNYEMLEALDAETGINLTRKHRPDLILMDIQLPGMDGLRATRMIKDDPDLKSIPIVAVTSYAMQGDDVKASEAGCAGYITKPINTKEFLKTIEQYLR